MSKVIIVGGHGKVALRLAELLSPAHHVSSIVRDESHFPSVVSALAHPVLLSLEDDSISSFTQTFEGSEVVYFSAGAGGKGGEARTKKVDYEGAVKVFDAIEGVKGAKPRLVLVSAIDVRDPEKIPDHYTQEDMATSKRIRSSMPAYMHWKYEADKNLAKRTAFKWTMLRPGHLTDEPGIGKATVGKGHLNGMISRDDVAKALALLVDREDAAGMGLDLVQGDTPIEEALDAAIKKGETDFLG